MQVYRVTPLGEYRVNRRSECLHPLLQEQSPVSAWIIAKTGTPYESVFRWVILVLISVRLCVTLSS